MTTEDKNIKTKLGLLELSTMLGNISQACKVMEHSRYSFIVSRSFLKKAGR